MFFILLLLSISLSSHVSASICLLLVHFFLSVLVGILVTQSNLIEALSNCEDVNSAFVGGAGDPMRLFVKSNWVDLSFVTASSNFLERTSVLSWEESDQGTLVTSSCQQSAREIQSYAGQRRLMGFYNLSMVLLINSYFNLTLLLIRRS